MHSVSSTRTKTGLGPRGRALHPKRPGGFVAHAASGPRARKYPRFFAGLFAAAMASLSLSMASPAMADEVGLDEYDFRIFGIVELTDDPLEDVRLVITGRGFEVEVETDAEGRW